MFIIVFDLVAKVFYLFIIVDQIYRMMENVFFFFIQLNYYFPHLFINVAW